MTEQQPSQEQKKRAGSIRQYATLGRARAPERLDVETSRSQKVEESERLNVEASKHLGEETSERQSVQEPERLNAGTSEYLGEETLERQDVQKSERLGVKTIRRERERHTIYLPPDLSKWVKHQAIDQEREISEIVTEALERYRAER